MDGVDGGHPSMTGIGHWRLATTSRQDIWFPTLRRANLAKRESTNRDSADWESTIALSPNTLALSTIKDCLKIPV